ncbi:MAG: class I SAM-dependent methyltransferase [Candidatus Beckwithbacteria bacterium]|nr:class I SAM-dependent methyltransferase [Patescibacteria group bacterium]
MKKIKVKDCYRSGTPINLDYHRSIKPEARKWSFLTKNIKSKNKKIKILDIGCGNGSIMLQLRKMGFTNLYGLEYEKQMFKRTLIEHPGLKIKQGDAQNLVDYANGFFDVVLSCHVLEHLPFPDKAVSEAVRVLKKGGIFVVGVPNGYHFNDRMIRMIQLLVYGKYDHLQRFSKKKIGRLLEKYGLIIKKFQVNKGSLELLKDVRMGKFMFLTEKIIYPVIKFLYWQEFSFEIMAKKKVG